MMRQQEAIREYVRQFVLDPLNVSVFRGLPEEGLQQFPGLDGDRHGQVLGIMELGPITLIPETNKSIRHTCNIRHSLCVPF